MKPVSDPALLAQLNGTPDRRPVADPALLAQLDGGASASTADKIVGSRPGRFALGASTLLSGPLQLGANIGSFLNKHAVAPVAEAMGATDVARHARDRGSVVADAINAKLKQIEESKQRGMKDAGTEGFDAMGMLGAAVPAVVGGAPKLAATLGGKVAQGAGLGAFFGGTTPVTNGGDQFWSDKATQAGTGAVIGGAVPLALAGAQKVGGAVRDTYDVMTGTDSGIDRLKRAYYERLIGKQNVPAVSASLRNADPILPGGKPTAAEAVSGNPFGSPIQAQQQVTARTFGGPSGEFGSRLANQDIVRGSAEIERDIVTKPMRDAALARTTNINARQFNNDILQIVADPQVQAVKPARTFLEGIANDAIAAAQSGDAQSLYSVRKYIDDLVNKRIESPENVAGFASTKLLAMKRAIDEAIENGGAGGTWKAYLSEYAGRSRAIDKSTERAAEMYRPQQTTSVPGGANIADSSATHLPNLLSRSAMIANYIARAMRNNVEPKIDASMARDMLDPKLMADVMDKSNGPMRKALAEALAKYGRTAAVAVPSITTAREIR